MKATLTRLFLLILVLYQFEGHAQNSPVTGKVTDPDNSPLPGASISIIGTTQGTATDEEGNFTINAAATATLSIHVLGFKTQEIAIEGRSFIHVVLQPDQESLDEVVVTGYTSQKKKDIVGSVAVVDVETMKSVPAGSAMQALQGQAPGVDIINSGSPGQSSSIFIRGITGFNTNPLVLIDGIQGQINDVPASDVESIQVLKDAGAASIYGARGANGVIIITTKKGARGRTKVSYESFYNVKIPDSDPIDLLNAEEYARIWSELNPATTLFPGGVIPDYAWRASPSQRGVAMEGDPVVNPSNYNFDPRDFNNNYIIAKLVKTGRTNMYEEIFRPALMMNHVVTASGGSERSTFLLSMGYLNDQGTLERTYLKRYNLRANSEFIINDNIRVGENLNVFYKDNPMVEYSPNHPFSSIGDAMKWLPFMPVYDIQGNFAGPFVGPGISEMGDWSNAKAMRHFSDNNRNRNYGIVGNVYLEVDFLKNFTARTRFGGNINNYYTQTFNYPSYWSSGGGGNNNSLSENSGFYTTAQWTNDLSYNTVVDKHTVSVLVGTEMVENKARSLTGSGQNFFLTDYNYLILGNAQNTLPPSSGASEDALFSLFGRLDYSFDDRYILGFTIRRDGFSAFGKDNRHGVFPAVAIGWRISEETFMKDVSWLNDLKIRASYGVMGNKEGINPANAYYTYGQHPGLSYYDMNGSGNSLVPGFYPLQNGNTYTSWERNELKNIGLDATLFNNQIDISVEVYKKSTDGLLRPMQAPSTAGEAASPWVNIGDIQNKGIDASLVFRKQLSQDWRLRLGTSFTSYRNKIVSLPFPGYVDEGQIRYQEGFPMSSFFGYKVIGIFQTAEEVAAHATQEGAEPGRFKYLDADGNGVITPDDRVHYGDPNPDFTLGLNLAASYRNFDFSAVMYGSFGQDIFNNTLEFLGNWSRGVSNKSRRVLKAWTPTNTNTDVPKNELVPSFSSYANNVFNSSYLEDGSFFRLRSLQVAYNVQADAVKSLGISNLKLYLQATNLFVITNYSGIDPEVAGGTGFRGVDSGNYPQEKGFVFGFNVTF